MDKQKSTETNKKDTDLQIFVKILQLFPDLHSLALYKIFERCDKNFVRTIDNILYIKRYCYFLNVIKKPELKNLQTFSTDVSQNQQVNTNISNNIQEPKNISYNYNNAENYFNTHHTQPAVQVQNHVNELYNFPGDTYKNIVSSTMYYPQTAYGNLYNSYHTTQVYDPNKPWNYSDQFYNSSGNSATSSVYNYSNSNMSSGSVNEYNLQPNINFYNTLHSTDYQGEQYSSTSSESYILSTNSNITE